MAVRKGCLGLFAASLKFSWLDASVGIQLLVPHISTTAQPEAGRRARALSSASAISFPPRLCASVFRGKLSESLMCWMDVLTKPRALAQVQRLRSKHVGPFKVLCQLP